MIPVEDAATAAVVGELIRGRDALAYHIDRFLSNATDRPTAELAVGEDLIFIQAITQAIDLLNDEG